MIKQLPNSLNEIQTGYPLRGLVINLLATLWPSLLKARFEWLGRLRNLRCRKLREVFTLFGKQKTEKNITKARFGKVYVNIRGRATGYREPFFWGFLKGKRTRNGDSSQQLPRNYLWSHRHMAMMIQHVLTNKNDGCMLPTTWWY